jgi:pimeloyl-ACP methyl ester carboxylesterase
MKTSRTTTRLLAVAVALTVAACGSSDGGSSSAEPQRNASSPTTTAVERPTEPIDELVTIGAGRMHIRCTGTGDTTVLLIAGWDEGSEAWTGIEPSIADHARVCSYDRFGTGTSDEPPTTQTFETQAADLDELLQESGESGPFVVVGHSFGGAEAVTFASTHPDEVDGLMLVDASPATWPDAVCSVPAYASGCALMRDPTKDGEQLDVFPAFEQVAAITTLGGIPMTVLTAAHRSSEGLTPAEHARLDAIWSNGMERWAQLSTASKVITVEHTGHAIQDDQPMIVLTELRQLLP